MVGERTIDGLRTLTLATDAAGGIEAAFAPDAGMVGCSLRHRGEELLGQRGGLADYAARGGTMGIPLLYPWANRLGADRFELLGREVALDGELPRLRRDENGLAIHGLLGGAPEWRVTRHEASDAGGVLAATFDFAADDRLLAAFPFPHELELEARLEGSKLTIATTIHATGEVPVPVAFGFHPYFCLPGVPRADWEVEMPIDEQLRLDSQMLPTGERVAAHVASGPLRSRTFDDAYTAPPGRAPFVLAGGGRRIDIAFGEGYPYAQVYAPEDDALIAFEPMTAPTNALLDGGSRLPVVAPGERFQAAFTVTITLFG